MKKILVAFLFFVGLAIAFQYGDFQFGNFWKGTYAAVPIKKSDKALTENFEIILENQKLLMENQKAILKNQKEIFDGQRNIRNFLQLLAIRLQLPMP